MEGKTIGIYFDKATLRLLDKLAEDDRRSRSNLVNVLIQQEAERRGVPCRPED